MDLAVSPLFSFSSAVEQMKKSIADASVALANHPEAHAERAKRLLRFRDEVVEFLRNEERLGINDCQASYLHHLSEMLERETSAFLRGPTEPPAFQLPTFPINRPELMMYTTVVVWIMSVVLGMFTM